MKTGLPLILFCIGSLLAEPSAAQPYFEDVTQETIGIVPFNPVPIAFWDYNNDGSPDLFLGDGGGFSGLIRGATFSLLHNPGKGRFASHNARLPATIAHQAALGDGVAFGDYDNDGDPDLFLTIGSVISSAPDLLLRNDRGRFSEVSAAAGLREGMPTDNAIWLDYDRDGHLDLYAGHWSLDGSPGLRNRLWRNKGDGTDRIAYFGPLRVRLFAV